jgi:hypothetical protein
MYTPLHRPSETFCNPFAVPALKYVLKTHIACDFFVSLSFAFRQDFRQQKDSRVCSAPDARTRFEIARDNPPTWPTRPHAPMMSNTRRHMKQHSTHGESRRQRSFWTSVRGRFGPRPHTMSLQNLQSDPGTTNCVCAIQENPREKIRNAQRVAGVPNPNAHGAVGTGGRNDRCGGLPTNSRGRFEGHM